MSSETSGMIKELQRQQKAELGKRIAEENTLKIASGLTPDEFSYIVDQNKHYDDIGFDQFLERKPINPIPQALQSGDVFNQLVERGALTSEKLGAIAKGNVAKAVNDLVLISPSQSASATLPAGAAATLTSTLKDRNDPNRIMLGVLNVTAYQDSFSDANKIPNGSNVVAGDWEVFTSHDWGTNNNRYTSALYYARNKSASSHVIIFQISWRYIGTKGAEV